MGSASGAEIHKVSRRESEAEGAAMLGDSSFLINGCEPFSIDEHGQGLTPLSMRMRHDSNSERKLPNSCL